jgi:hypothetical protein
MQVQHRCARIWLETSDALEVSTSSGGSCLISARKRWWSVGKALPCDKGLTDSKSLNGTHQKLNTRIYISQDHLGTDLSLYHGTQNPVPLIKNDIDATPPCAVTFADLEHILTSQ